MKNLIFFAIASAILLFSIIITNIAPIINDLVPNSKDWFKRSCKSISDEYDDTDAKSLADLGYTEQKQKDEDLDEIKSRLNRCNRKKAMVGLEYIVFDLNIIFGFICALLGFLHFINVGNMGKYIGLIGLCAGAIGFVLTFVYVIYSGLVFNDIDENPAMRIDSDGAHLEWNESKGRYTCIFYDKDDIYSIYLRFSDYGKKYLSYHKDLSYPEGDIKFKFQNYPLGCNEITSFSDCKNLDDESYTVSNRLNKKREYLDGTTKKGECDKLYYIPSSSSSLDNL